MSHGGRSCNVFCTGINPDTLLFLLASFVLYVGFLQLLNWPVVYCLTIAVPFLISAILYVIGGFALLFGIICSSRGLISISPWILCLGLVSDVVYDITICIDQKCICENVHRFRSDNLFYFAVAYEYFTLGFFGGLNYVAILYVILLILDYLKDVCCEN